MDRINILRASILELQQLEQQLLANNSGELQNEDPTAQIADNERNGFTPMLVKAEKRNHSYFNGVLNNLMDGSPEVVNTYYII